MRLEHRDEQQIERHTMLGAGITAERAACTGEQHPDA